MKLWKKGVLGLLVILTAYAGFVFLQFRSLNVEQISDDVYVIRGAGSNTTVLKTDSGTVVIDTMTLPMQGGLIRAKAEELTNDDVIMLINTHYHLDHTHGNPAFDPGTRVVSTKRTLSHLQALDADFWEGDAAELLPNETFTDRQTLIIGNKTLSLIHPGRGHTDGDLVVLIVEDGIIAMGDLLFYQHYPNIDLEAGGSVQQWPTTLDEVLKLDFSIVVPGHGATTNKQGIQRFRQFMWQLGQIGLTAALEQTSLEETLESTQLTADQNYKELRIAGISLGLDREFVLRRAWQEANNKFELKNKPQ